MYVLEGSKIDSLEDGCVVQHTELGHQRRQYRRRWLPGRKISSRAPCVNCVSCVNCVNCLTCMNVAEPELAAGCNRMQSDAVG